MARRRWSGSLDVTEGRIDRQLLLLCVPVLGVEPAANVAEEGRKLGEQKKKLYAEYRKAKADMQEVTTIKANIDYLLGYSEPGRKKEQER